MTFYIFTVIIKILNLINTVFSFQTEIKQHSVIKINKFSYYTLKIILNNLNNNNLTKIFMISVYFIN